MHYIYIYINIRNCKSIKRKKNKNSRSFDNSHYVTLIKRDPKLTKKKQERKKEKRDTLCKNMIQIQRRIINIGLWNVMVFSLTTRADPDERSMAILCNIN